MYELPEDGTVVPKHVVEIKDYAVMYVLVALVTGNKLRSLFFNLSVDLHRLVRN